VTLGEVIRRLYEFSDDLVISAERNPEWTYSSRAAVATAHDADGDLPYFLEVSLAKDSLRVWSEWREGATPSEQDRFEAVRHYATFDSYLPSAEPS
jgi:hypothetical protein